jgi:hypothetical protein
MRATVGAEPPARLYARLARLASASLIRARLPADEAEEPNSASDAALAFVPSAVRAASAGAFWTLLSALSLLAAPLGEPDGEETPLLIAAAAAISHLEVSESRRSRAKRDGPNSLLHVVPIHLLENTDVSADRVRLRQILQGVCPVFLASEREDVSPTSGRGLAVSLLVATAFLRQRLEPDNLATPIASLIAAHEALYDPSLAAAALEAQADAPSDEERQAEAEDGSSPELAPELAPEDHWTVSVCYVAAGMAARTSSAFRDGPLAAVRALASEPLPSGCADVILSVLPSLEDEDSENSNEGSDEESAEGSEASSPDTDDMDGASSAVDSSSSHSEPLPGPVDLDAVPAPEEQSDLDDAAAIATYDRAIALMIAARRASKTDKAAQTMAAARVLNLLEAAAASPSPASIRSLALLCAAADAAPGAYRGPGSALPGFATRCGETIASLTKLAVVDLAVPGLLGAVASGDIPDCLEVVSGLVLRRGAASSSGSCLRWVARALTLVAARVEGPEVRQACDDLLGAISSSLLEGALVRGSKLPLVGLASLLRGTLCFSALAEPLIEAILAVGEDESPVLPPFTALQCAELLGDVLRAADSSTLLLIAPAVCSALSAVLARFAGSKRGREAAKAARKALQALNKAGWTADAGSDVVAGLRTQLRAHSQVKGPESGLCKECLKLL